MFCDSQTDYSSLGSEERLDLVKNLYVERDVSKKINEIIESAQADSKVLPDPSNWLIVGDTGYGKTTEFERYMNRFPEYEEGGINIQPVVYVMLDEETTIKDVATLLLEALGDPSPEKGTRSERARRVRKLLKTKRVKIVLIDEFQHVVEASGDKSLPKVADFFKTTSKKAKVPFILTGMPGSLELLKLNRQLHGISNKYEIGSYDFLDNADRDRFRSFLTEVDLRLPFPEHSRLSDLDCARKLLYASGGNLRLLMNLIRQAAAHAIDCDHIRLEMVDLQYGFDKEIKYKRHDIVNPFDDDWQAPALN